MSRLHGDGVSVPASQPTLWIEQRKKRWSIFFDELSVIFFCTVEEHTKAESGKSLLQTLETTPRVEDFSRSNRDRGSWFSIEISPILLIEINPFRADTKKKCFRGSSAFRSEAGGVALGLSLEALSAFFFYA